ncbi:hypothetical protein BC829DRAFT_255259 [Chytridium lagenaria]|nr:hypothetical protein BC829DRAFT_255259 [Chytridium lagenaria]
MDGDEDERIARMLQEQFDREATSYQAADDHTIDSDNEIPLSVTAPLPEDGEEWRLQACLDDEAFARLLQEDFDGEAAERVGDGDDPLPDLHTLFLNFDEQFFEGKLKVSK